MTPPELGLCVGAATAAAHVAATLVVLRLPGKLSPVARHAASAAVTHVGGVAVAAAVVGPFAYWPAAAVGGFAAVAWLFAFSAVYKSVSLRVLTELARAPGGAIPFAAITDDYVKAEFTARTRVVVALGWVREGPDGFELTPDGAAAARRVAAVQRLCGIGRSGLYG